MVHASSDRSSNKIRWTDVSSLFVASALPAVVVEMLNKVSLASLVRALSDLATWTGRHICLSIYGGGGRCAFDGPMVLWKQQRQFSYPVDSDERLYVMDPVTYSSPGRGSFWIELLAISRRSTIFWLPTWIIYLCSSDDVELLWWQDCFTINMCRWRGWRTLRGLDCIFSFNSRVFLYCRHLVNRGLSQLKKNNNKLQCRMQWLPFTLSLQFPPIYTRKLPRPGYLAHVCTCTQKNIVKL